MWYTCHKIISLAQHHIISSFFPRSRLSSSSYPNSQHFLISLSWVCKESRRSGSRLTLIMAEQPRFGFPALNTISYVQSVFISLLLWIFFLWDFAAVLLYQLLKYSALHIALLHILAKGMAFKLNFFSLRRSTSHCEFKNAKVFSWYQFVLWYTMRNASQSLALPGTLTAGLPQCCLQPSFMAQ